MSGSHAANPFPGLRPFRTDEHHLFFGREEQTAELLGRLRQHRFLAVVGTSGSGKSSLVRAGLIPALHRGTMTQAGSTWEVVILRPGGDPITNLARALNEAELYDAEDPESLPRLKATLSRSLFGLVEAVRQTDAIGPGVNLLVVVDQFEEIFRFRQQSSGSEEAASAFVRLLLTASEQAERRIYVAITMRSDYLGDCSHIPGLAEAVNRGEYLIPRLSRDQKRDAIEKPVGVGGAKIAPRLVQRMLNDVGDDPDQLPVLQHALMRAWDHWAAVRASGEPIDLEQYEAIGGMEEALSRHADEVFLSFPDTSHRSACARLFKALTEKGADNRGVRRPTRLERLQRIAGADRQAITSAIDAFRKPGVTFLMPGTDVELQERTVIDLSHESLMRVWTRLRGWVEEDALSARVYRRLSETAELWKAERAGLFRNPDLEIALSWRNEANPNSAWAEQYGGGFERAMEFLDRSRDAAHAEKLAWEEARHRELEQAKALAAVERRRAEERHRTAKRFKALAAGVALVAVFAVLASVFAVAARREALENSQRADANARLAQEKEAAATALAAVLKQTAVEGDFKLGVERIESGDGADGLAHLARALRTDSSYQPASLRLLSLLTSGRNSLATLGVIEQENVITSHYFNVKEDLVFTTDVGASGDQAPERFVWDALSGRKLYPVASGTRNLSVPTWSEDGKRLFVSFPDESVIRGFEARTGKELNVFSFPERVRGFALGRHPDFGDLVLVLHSDSMQVWKLATAEPLGARIVRPSPVTRGFGFTPDGRVYAAYGDRVVGVYDAVSGKSVAEIATNAVDIDSDGVFFSPGGEFVAVRESGGKRVGIWPVGAAILAEGGGDLGRGRGVEGPASAWIEFDAGVDLWFLPSADRISFHWDDPQTRRLHVAVHDLLTHARAAFFESEGPVAGVLYPAEEGARTRTLRFPLFGVVAANTVRIWDLETGNVLQTIVAPAILGQSTGPNPVRWWNRDVRFSPDGRRVATVALDHDVMLWDIFTARPLLTEPLAHEGFATVVFSPDGGRLVSHDREKRVFQVWDSRSGRRLIEPVPQVNPNALYFSSRGNRLILQEAQETFSGQTRKQILGRLRPVDLGMRPALAEPLLYASGHEAAAQFTPDGKRLVIFAKPRTEEPDQIMVWDFASRRVLRSLPLPGIVHGYQDSMHCTPDGRHVVLGCQDGTARVWDLESGELRHELEHEGAVRFAELSAGGMRLLTGTIAGKIRNWDLSSGALLGEPLDLGAGLRGLAVAPQGELLAVPSADFRLRLIDLASGKDRKEPLQLSGFAEHSAFSHDGAHVAVVSFAPEVLIVEAATGEVVHKLIHRDSCRRAAFSPDGRLLAVGSGLDLTLPIGEVTLWDWKAGQKLGQPMNTRGAAGPMAFSRDGSMLATGTILRSGGAVQVWDVATGQPLTDPVAGRAAVDGVSFHPQMTALAAVWSDGSVRLVDLPAHDASVPDWLPRLAEAVGGQRLHSGRSGIEAVPHQEIETLRAQIEAAGGEASTVAQASARWALWLFSDPESRAISPGSTMTFSQYLGRVRRSERVEDLEEALRLSPSDALSHARLGAVLLDLLSAQRDLGEGLRRHWRESAKWYTQRAVDLAPDDPEVWALRVKMLQDLGAGPAAIDALARAAALNRARGEAGSASVYFLEAESLANDGKWEEAAASLRKALSRLSARSVASAVGDDVSAATAAPIYTFLRLLEPYRTRSGFRDLTLPSPIPGTFADFDAVAEGRTPAGWSTAHAAQRSLEAPGGLAEPASDVFLDWRVLSYDRFATWSEDDGRNNFGSRALSPAVVGRVNGALVGECLKGGFLFALASGEDANRVQTLTTPDFDCSARNNVHVVFFSAYDQKPGGMGALEYSIDGGASWLPVIYLIDSTHIARDSAGQVDAAQTLAKAREDVPSVLDADGSMRGGSYAAFIGAPVGRDLASALQGRRRDYWRESRRLEVFRLLHADRQAAVRCRFTHVGKNGGFWGIDRFGLYELEALDLEKRPEFLDRSAEARVLASAGLQSLLGAVSLSVDVKWLARADLELVPQSPLAAPAAELEPEEIRRRRVGILDARLLLGRALEIAPEDAEILLVAAAAAAHSGEVEDGFAWARAALAREPLGRSSAPPLAAVYVAAGDARQKEGDVAAALVSFELAHILLESSGVNANAALIERLAAGGQTVQNVVLVPQGSRCKYFDEGTSPDPSWKEPELDDASWPNGTARLGFGGDGEVTIIRSGSAQGRHVSVYFRLAFDVSDPGRFRQLKLRVARDDGVVVYLNGEEVVRDNMPAGELRFDTLALSTVNDADETTFFEFLVPARGLASGRNVIAAEVHQSTRSSSDLGFDLELEALGGLKAPEAELAALDAAETRLAIPDLLRSALWASRAERLRAVGRLETATEALERAERLAPQNPSVAYEEARLLSERGADDAAYASFVKAAQGAIALKASRHAAALFLPRSLKTAVEPLVEPTGRGLAAAASEIARLRLGDSGVEAGWLLRWSEELDPDGQSAMRARANAYVSLGKFAGALRTVDVLLARAEAKPAAVPSSVRERKELLSLRERALEGLGRTAEAAAVREEIFQAPPRDPRLSPKLLDLSAHYNSSLYDGRGWHTSEPEPGNLRRLPETFRPRAGIELDLRGIVQLNSGIYPASDALLGGKDVNTVARRSFPDRVDGIRVDLEAKALHFLVSTMHAGSAVAGVEVARFVVHYEDGSSADVPLVFGEDVIDWAYLGRKLESSKVAWESTSQGRHLNIKSWNNPHPQTKILHLDFVSAKAYAAPFLVAVTAE